MNRLRAVFGTSLHTGRLQPTALEVAQGMYNGMEADKVTYVSPNPPLPTFLILIQNLASAQQVVRTRVTGAREMRDVQLSLLVTGMESERTFVQTLADGSPLHAAVLIRNAGLVVASSPIHTKDLLTLRLGPPGSVICDANVGLLVGALAAKPTQNRFFNWEHTLDGGKTFVTMPSTTTGRTMIQNLVPLTMVGVRVNLNVGSGPGPWSPLVTIQLH